MANRITIQNTVTHIGDIIKVHQKVIEKGKERIQIFSGVLIAIGGNEFNRTFCVRRIATQNIGVERIWPVNSPMIAKVEIIRLGKVKRAKLYYLRDKVGKQATKIETKDEVVEKTSEVKKTINKLNAKKSPGKTGGKSSPKISSK